ncbi:MAG: hypothetical protein NVSMB25_05550 [Thermoleophilaceae bacterium]
MSSDLRDSGADSPGKAEAECKHPARRGGRPLTDTGRRPMSSTNAAVDLAALKTLCEGLHCADSAPG